MRRHRDLFETICSFENLLSAAHKAARGKRSRDDVARFGHRIETELPALRSELLDGTYRPGAYRTFAVHDTKPRQISAAPFRDRVVHHALCNVIEPLFDRSFISDSYASRKGRGFHAALNRLTAFMWRSDYCLKLDIRRYFPSIDHAILMSLIRRKVACERTLDLVARIVAHSPEERGPAVWFPGDDLLSPLDRRAGLPLGNQTSQFFGNVYLNPLDHFVTEALGCSHYIRYVDDMVVLGDDKSALWDVRDSIRDFAGCRLRLELHPAKQAVMPVTCGVDFLGWRVFPDHRRLRRSNGVRFARLMRRLTEEYADGKVNCDMIGRRIAGWIGHARHGDTWGLRTALIEGVVFRRGRT